MNQYIYADNAATTQLDLDAFEAMKKWLLEDFGNPSQPYSFSRSAKKALFEARVSIAESIGANPEEIFFTSGGTESNNWVIKSSAFHDSKEKTIVTSSFEHHAILKSCEFIKSQGYPVSYLNPNHSGVITTESLEKNFPEKTQLVSIMYANNEIGSIQPIRNLCSITHSQGALFHTDAVQAIGHVQINVHELGIDFLSASAHKFNGPKGIGFLYIRNGVELPAFLNGGSQEFGYRAGTENVASIVGMAKALENNCKNLDANIQYVKSLEERLLFYLRDNEVSFIRNGIDNLPGLVSLSFRGQDAEAILHRMDLLGIGISTGAACDSKNTKISHVLKAINLDEALAKGTIRISLGKNNSIEEVEIIAKALKRIIG